VVGLGEYGSGRTWRLFFVADGRTGWTSLAQQGEVEASSSGSRLGLTALGTPEVDYGDPHERVWEIILPRLHHLIFELSGDETVSTWSR